MKKDVSIVIPTFNEAGNILLLIAKLKQKLRLYNYEIIIVDDNSSDGTGTLVRKKYQKDKRIVCIIRKEKPDLGLSILTGINTATGKVIVGMDADFNHDPGITSGLIEAATYYDLVVASRFIPGGGMVETSRYYTSYLFNMVLRWFLGYPITDNSSGYYAIKKEKLRQLNPTFIYQGYGEYHLRLVYKAKKNHFSFYEIPVYYQKRTYGVSKSKLFQMFITQFKTAIMLLVQGN